MSSEKKETSETSMAKKRVSLKIKNMAEDTVKRAGKNQKIRKKTR